jgi:hypothetical protein
LAMFDIFRTKQVPEDIVYQSTSAEGTVESIHIGGRTEVVMVTGVKLTRCALRQLRLRLRGL